MSTPELFQLDLSIDEFESVTETFERLGLKPSASKGDLATYLQIANDELRTDIIATLLQKPGLKLKQVLEQVPAEFRPAHLVHLLKGIN